MSNERAPILSYQLPTPNTPNFGTRAAKLSWLAPLAAVPLFAVALLIRNLPSPFGIGGALLWITGLVSSVVALVSIRRHGRSGILRPAIIGICLAMALLVLGGAFIFYALVEAGAAAAR